MSNFADALRNQSNQTRTENGALAYSTTGGLCLDLFARLGGLRNASENEVIRLWREARNEDKTLADNMILYARNIREGGIGERKIAKILLRELAKTEPEKIVRNFNTIVNAGRWDDLWLAFEGTSVEGSMWNFVRMQFVKDVKDMKANKPVSLLGKWLPSINTSSADTRRRAKRVCQMFSLTEKTYRKTLSALRKYIDVVEKKMSSQDFNKINYEAVPSVAMTRYRSAFGRHDFERFDKYIQAVNKGTAKINAGVSFPYELIRPYTSYTTREDAVLEAQWKALPNFVEGNHNVIVMSDVSGSMSGTPMDVSVSLGIYFAERNTGAYQNLLMAFTDIPKLYELNPNSSLLSRVKTVKSHCGYNTNLDGALKSIFDTAVRVHEAPEALVVISDGEIDYFCSRHDVDSIVSKWQKEYARFGLKAPKIIMWNVESRGNRFLEKKNNAGIAYISGSSAATFKELSTLISMDAETAMREILMKPQFCWC
jgi:hypothetical protein